MKENNSQEKTVGSLTRRRLLMGMGSVALTAGLAPQKSFSASEKKILHGLVSVKDFGAKGDGDTDDTSAVQAAVDFALRLIDSSDLNSYIKAVVGILFPYGNYYLGSTVNVPRAGLAFYADSRKGATIKVEQTGIKIGSDHGSAKRVQSTCFTNLSFYATNSTKNDAIGIHLRRTLDTFIQNCHFSGFRRSLHMESAFTTHILGCRFSGVKHPINNVHIYIEGTDESASTKNRHTPSGGCHITDCEIIGNRKVDGTIGIYVKSVDGLYVNNCHFVRLKHSVLFKPDASGKNRTIYDCTFINCYFDGPKDLSDDNANVVIGGVVKHGIILSSGVRKDSYYRGIRFSQCFFRNNRHGVAKNSDALVKIAVTDISSDGVPWIEATSQELSTFQFVACDFRGATGTALMILGYPTYVEPRGVVVDSCVFEDNNTKSHASDAQDLFIEAESAVITNNLFKQAMHPANFAVRIGASNAPSGSPSFVVQGNEASNTNCLKEPFSVVDEANAELILADNIVPSSGRHIRQIYSKTVVNNQSQVILWSEYIPQGATVFFEIEVIGSSKTGTRRCVYRFTATYFRVIHNKATVAIPPSSNPSYMTKNNLDTPPTLSLSNNTVELKVSTTGGSEGNDAEAVRWIAKVNMTTAR